MVQLIIECPIILYFQKFVSSFYAKRCNTIPHPLGTD